MKQRILITENITGRAIEDLRERYELRFEPELWRDPLALREAVATCDALIVRNQTQVNAEVLACAASLRVIGRAGAGLDNIDTTAASDAGVVVVSTPDQNSVSVAELAMGLMLALARQVPRADAETRGGGWNRTRFMGRELRGRTLGIVGLGRIGFLTARRALAFGMNILVHDDFISPDAVAVVESHATLTSLDDLLAKSDFVSCHVPLTPATRHSFDYEKFCLMKADAAFINLSRGEVVDEVGLERALREKRLAAAALDVREQEPPQPGGLGELSNVILTPHIAAFTREAQDRVVQAVCADVDRVLGGGAARNAVNFPQPGPRV